MCVCVRERERERDLDIARLFFKFQGQRREVPTSRPDLNGEEKELVA